MSDNPAKIAELQNDKLVETLRSKNLGVPVCRHIESKGHDGQQFVKPEYVIETFPSVEFLKSIKLLKLQIRSLVSVRKELHVETSTVPYLEINNTSNNNANAAAASSSPSKTTTSLTAEEAEKILQEAAPLFTTSKYSEAIELYSKVIDGISLSESDDASLKTILSRALSNRSGSFLKLRKLKETLEDARRCVAVRPSWIRAHLQVAEAAEELEEFDLAVSAYQAAMKAEDRTGVIGNVPSIKDLEHDIISVKRRQFVRKQFNNTAASSSKTTIVPGGVGMNIVKKFVISNNINMSGGGNINMSHRHQHHQHHQHHQYQQHHQHHQHQQHHQHHQQHHHQHHQQHQHQQNYNSNHNTMPHHQSQHHQMQQKGNIIGHNDMHHQQHHQHQHQHANISSSGAENVVQPPRDKPAPENGTTGQKVDTRQIVEVYGSNGETIYIIPRSDIFHLPPPPEDVNQKQKLTLCSHFDAQNPNHSCTNVRCRHVHASTRNATPHGVHVNYVWNNVREVTYERFPPGQVFEVASPNQNVANDACKIASHYILKTRFLESNSNRGVIRHCAHYYFNRACNRGCKCLFVHAISLTPKNNAETSTTDPETMQRKLYGRTQLRPATSTVLPTKSLGAQQHQQQQQHQHHQHHQHHHHQSFRLSVKDKLECVFVHAISLSPNNSDNNNAESSTAVVDPETMQRKLYGRTQLRPTVLPSRLLGAQQQQQQQLQHAQWFAQHHQQQQHQQHQSYSTSISTLSSNATTTSTTNV